VSHNAVPTQNPAVPVILQQNAHLVAELEAEIQSWVWVEDEKSVESSLYLF